MYGNVSYLLLFTGSSTWFIFFQMLKWLVLIVQASNVGITMISSTKAILKGLLVVVWCLVSSAKSQVDSTKMVGMGHRGSRLPDIIPTRPSLYWTFQGALQYWIISALFWGALFRGTSQKLWDLRMCGHSQVALRSSSHSERPQTVVANDHKRCGGWFNLDLRIRPVACRGFYWHPTFHLILEIGDDTTIVWPLDELEHTGCVRLNPGWWTTCEQRSGFMTFMFVK